MKLVPTPRTRLEPFVQRIVPDSDAACKLTFQLTALMSRAELSASTAFAVDSSALLPSKALSRRRALEALELELGIKSLYRFLGSVKLGEALQEPSSVRAAPDTCGVAVPPVVVTSGGVIVVPPASAAVSFLRDMAMLGVTILEARIPGTEVCSASVDSRWGGIIEKLLGEEY